MTDFCPEGPESDNSFPKRFMKNLTEMHCFAQIHAAFYSAHLQFHFLFSERFKVMNTILNEHLGHLFEL